MSEQLRAALGVPSIAEEWAELAASLAATGHEPCGAKRLSFYAGYASALSSMILAVKNAKDEHEFGAVMDHLRDEAKDAAIDVLANPANGVQ